MPGLQPRWTTKDTLHSPINHQGTSLKKNSKSCDARTSTRINQMHGMVVVNQFSFYSSCFSKIFVDFLNQNFNSTKYSPLKYFYSTWIISSQNVTWFNRYVSATSLLLKNSLRFCSGSDRVTMSSILSKNLRSVDPTNRRNIVSVPIYHSLMVGILHTFN